MRIIFLGSPEFAIPSLRMLAESPWEIAAVYTQPDRPAGRGKRLTPTPVKAMALECGIPVETPDTLRSEEVLAKMRSLEPDLVVVVASRHKVPDPILALPPLGCVNVHPSLLPRYRGACPIQWTLIRGEEKTGVTTILLDKGWDTGGILLQRTVDIYPWETYGDLAPRLAVLGAELLYDTVYRLERGDLCPTPQDPEEATPAPKLKPEDAILDWNRGAQELHQRIRGLSPVPGAVTFWRGQRLKVLLSEPAEEMGPGRPGEIIRSDPRSGVFVATGSETLELKELQPPGKRSMPATDFVNGYKPEVGEILGGSQT